jgi:hypothetical protein
VNKAWEELGRGQSERFNRPQMRDHFEFKVLRMYVLIPLFHSPAPNAMLYELIAVVCARVNRDTPFQC